jgi:hypothetical protein
MKNDFMTLNIKRECLHYQVKGKDFMLVIATLKDVAAPLLFIAIQLLTNDCKHCK